ncbi:hypothetical protein NTE_02098 [Candidatus Nitrososphaera evergladensis SR1]|uniref:Uncharacterized protein n=1 Tax=Candidatus Nitrososphaera evergladensis SR1 TaxID=1459636 RepID=A0A075MSM2_9ARCH|nr:hypothetical protein [Candidatus Nitrososphaera evergladensis]AIF84153.1 hypothetical protein NTE_02098 [Candidatus Nitrososphaera evergladensis SR1]
MAIDQSTLIQINATIIAGAIVLLTINAAIDITHSAFNRYAVTLTALAIIIPFAGSSIRAFDEKELDAAKKLTQGGFGVLIIGLAALAFLVLFDDVRGVTAPVKVDSNMTSIVDSGQPQIAIDPLTWATVGLAVGTFVLAIVAFFSLRESKKLRIEAQLPNFAVEPAQQFGDRMLRLNLVNNGQGASGIMARCNWGKDLYTLTNSKSTYILSLAKGGYAGLDVPIDQIKLNGEILKIMLECKDSSGQDYTAEVLLDFNKIQGSGITIAYQNNYFLTLYDAIKGVSDKLYNINSAIDKVASKIK